MGMSGAEAVMKVARVGAEAQLTGRVVSMGMTMLVGMGMGMGMIVSVFVIMTFDSGFTFAAAAHSTHRQTPEITRPTNP